MKLLPNNSEAAILKRVMMEASKLGLRVFRNNVGMLKDNKGTQVKYGLCTGSSDLIGWTAQGKFVAIEVKSQFGDVSEEQQNFLNQVEKAGGFACVIRDEKNLKIVLDEYLKKV